jgi:hypothetical protein
MPKNSPLASTPAAASSARWLAEPPDRSMGIMPRAGKMWRVFQLSMYSALPTNVMRRGSATGSTNESSTDVWLGHRMAGPSSGRWPNPSARTRHANRAVGFTTTRATG